MAKLPHQIADTAAKLEQDTRRIDASASGVRELAEQFGELKKSHELASGIVKDLGEMWDACEKELIQEMISEGISSIKIEGYGNFILSQSAYPSVNAATKPQFYQYLKASGNGDLLKLDVPPQTLSAFLKRHLEELRKQFQDKGVTLEQADMLAQYQERAPAAEPGGLEIVGRPYADARKSVGVPLDEMTADEIAKALLKSQGASMFTKQGISLRK